MTDDARLAVVPAVVELAARLATDVDGIYVGGSVATGDYRPGVSDIDAVALVAQPPSPSARGHLVAVHRQLMRDVPGAAALHCVYVSRRHVDDPRFTHWTWAFEELFRRTFSGIARAELLAGPVVVRGPAPPTWLPAMSPDALRAAARAELSGYWHTAVRKRAIWDRDVYVDHGLTTVARADITVEHGRLATKTEAIAHLADLGLPERIRVEVEQRRKGVAVPLTAPQRTERARTVRRFVRDHIERLT